MVLAKQMRTLAPPLKNSWNRHWFAPLVFTQQDFNMHILHSTTFNGHAFFRPSRVVIFSLSVKSSSISLAGATHNISRTDKDGKCRIPSWRWDSGTNEKPKMLSLLPHLLPEKHLWSVSTDALILSQLLCGRLTPIILWFLLLDTHVMITGAGAIMKNQSTSSMIS